LNDIGTTIRMGATRNSATTSATTTTSIGPSAPEAVEAGEPVVDRQEDPGCRQEHYRDRGREAPREELLDLLVDELRDHHVARCPEQDRRHEEPEADDEDEQAAVHDAGKRQRQEDAAERGAR